MNKKTQNIIFYIFIFVMLLFIVGTMTYLSRGTCFYDDDSVWGIYFPNEPLFDCLIGETRFIHGGYYLGFFLCKFLSNALPIMLSIHPFDFTSFHHGVIKGIFTVFVILSLTKFTTTSLKSKLIYIHVAFFLTSYCFMSAAISSGIYTVSYNFYRYFFSFIFFGLFWHYIYKNLLDENKYIFNKKDLLPILCITFCGFVLGTSIEISFYVSLFLCLLLMFYNVLVLFISNIFKNEDIKRHKFNINLKFYIPLLGLVLGILLFVTNPGSLNVAIDRGMSNITLSFDMLKEFSQLYYFYFFERNPIYWILFIIIFSFASFLALKQKEYKEIYFSTFLFFSILTVSFSLILCGKTHSHNFFIVHYNIRLLLLVLFILPLLLNFSYLCKFLNKRIRINIVKCFIITCFIFPFYLILYSLYNIYYSWEPFNFAEKALEVKKKTYILEKISRFYILKDESPVLPCFLENLEAYPFITTIKDENKIIITNNIKSDVFNDYYKKVYKEDKDVIFSLDENALEIFYQKGGVITEEELNNISFSKLKDKDFVLNNID